MVAGIPGAGIGGLFYLLSAFMMPVRALRRRLRDGEVRSGVGRQVLIAAGIVGGIWLAGWLLGVILVGTGTLTTPNANGLLARIPGASHNVVRMAVLLGGVATLGVVLLGIEVCRLVYGSRPQDRRVAAP